MAHVPARIEIPWSWLFGLWLAFGLVEAGWGQDSLPEGNGKEVVQVICTICHPLTNITETRLDRPGWQAIVTRMVAEGAPLTDEDVGTVVQYLAKNFGKAPRTESSESSSRDDLEEASQPGPLTEVNLNTATARELEVALGLSGTEAQAVLVYRKKNGKFAKWEDLKKVPGLDIQRIESKKDRLTF